VIVKIINRKIYEEKQQTIIIHNAEEDMPVKKYHTMV
jgi:hypothetical protein